MEWKNAVGTTEDPLSQNNSSLLESHRSQAGGRGGDVAAWALCGGGLAGCLVDGRLEAEGPAGKEGRVHEAGTEG